MEDDWGYAYQDRIFAAPYLCLLDPAQAEVEVARVLEHGARCVVVRSGPVQDPLGPRSLGDPAHDRVWARSPRPVPSSPTTRASRATASCAEAWGGGSEFEAFRNDPFRQLITGHRPIFDTIAALVCHGVFRRFPALRVATIESGSDWVPLLASGPAQVVQAAARLPSTGIDPVQQCATTCGCRRTTRTTSARVAEVLGAERVLFGSD